MIDLPGVPLEAAVAGAEEWELGSAGGQVAAAAGLVPADFWNARAGTGSEATDAS